MGQQREQYLHFLATVLDITCVIEDEGIALVESLEFLLQGEFGLSPEEPLDQQSLGLSQSPEDIRAGASSYSRVPGDWHDPQAKILRQITPCS